MMSSLRFRRGRDAALASVGLTALAGFVWLSSRVKTRAVRRVDHAVLEAVGGLRTQPVDALVRDVTALGGVPLIGLIHVGAAIALRHSRVALVQLAAGSLGGAAADLTLKQHFARPRPRSIPALEYVTRFSYPSGHSIAASSLYLTLAFAATRDADAGQRAAAIGAASVLAVAVGASRVYLGVHHPSDVVAGLAIGTAWACLLEALLGPRGDFGEGRELGNGDRRGRRMRGAAGGADAVAGGDWVV